MALTFHTEGPVAHGMDGQNTFQSGHIHDIGRNAQSQLQVQAQIFAAEEDIVNDDGEGIVAGGIVHGHVGESAHIHIFHGGVGIGSGKAAVSLLVQRTELRSGELDLIVFRRIVGGAESVLGLGSSAQNDLLIGAGGDQEGQIHCRAEANHTGLAALGTGSTIVIDHAQLAVAQVEQHAHDILERLSHRGPQQCDDLTADTSPFAVLGIGNQTVVLTFFQLRQRSYTGMDVGVAAGGVDIRVEIHRNGAVVLRNGTGTVTDIQTAV